jgi:leucyl aminopeptidase
MENPQGCAKTLQNGIVQKRNFKKIKVHDMKASLENRHETTFPSDALILPLFEDKGLRPYHDINKTLDGLLKKICSSGEFSGKLNQATLVHTHQKIKPQRILLIGLGKTTEITREKLRKAGGMASSSLRIPGIKHVSLSTGSISELKLLPEDFLEGFMLSHYRFDKYQNQEHKKSLQRITILSRRNLKKSIKWTETIVHATHFARDLVNTPANDMTPSAMAKAARSLKGVTVRVIEKNQAVKLGMGAYTAIARGSREPAKFIVASYKRKNIPPMVLIGKSITFDSGGLSLKQRENMNKMKYDMAGGAAVLGVLKAVSETNLPLHLIGLLPATENLPGGNALKPGDVVRAINGKTIEIISTDAEGRLALADALGYAKKFKPQAIIDIATLTGACQIALGSEAIAMMGNDEALLNALEKASAETAERVWKMPLFEEYRDYIQSDIATLKNYSGISASLAVAGYFLKQFVHTTPWVHLDIAGTAWLDKGRGYIPKGATGIGVRLLLNFLKNS